MKLHIHSLILASIVLFNGCRDEETHFSGTIASFLPQVELASIQADTLEFSGAYTPLFAVYDSLLFLCNIQKGSYIFDVYNIDTKSLIGHFFHRGHGHDEYTVLTSIYGFFKENNKLKTLLTAPNEQKLLIWDITESIKQGRTIDEMEIPYKWQRNSPIPASRQILLSNDRILTYTPSCRFSDEKEPTLPLYEIRNIPDYEKTNEIMVFTKNFKERRNQRMTPDCFFWTSLCLKPDKSKFVEVMFWLPQINIVDIQSKEIKGYRMKGGADFSIFEQSMDAATNYYQRVQANNDYIFALWAETDWRTIKGNTSFNILHVFDWNGRLLKKIRLETPIQEMFLDTERNILYGCQEDAEQLFCYHISDMIF